MEDELDDPRSLALRDWATLTRLADALVARSHQRFAGWGHVVTFAGATATRIGEASGRRAHDIDTTTWTWNVRRRPPPPPAASWTRPRRASVLVSSR